MKVAIVADIHANLQALSAVLSKARLAKADALLFAGDLIGYYFQPAECLRLLLEWEGPMFAVRGNHEEMYLEATTSLQKRNDYVDKYGPGIEIALNQLLESEFRWISRLPHPLEINCLGRSIVLCHGSPGNINEYVYPDSPIDEICLPFEKSPDILILGHTHYPFVRHAEDCLIINPGSVGQPRNRVPGAHWALLDTQTMNVELLVERYDMNILQQDCVRLAPNHPYLHEVLVRS